MLLGGPLASFVLQHGTYMYFLGNILRLFVFRYILRHRLRIAPPRLWLKNHMRAISLRISAGPTFKKTCPESVALLSVSRNYLVDQQPLPPSSSTIPSLKYSNVSLFSCLIPSLKTSQLFSSSSTFSCPIENITNNL